MADFKTSFLRTLSFEDDQSHPGKVTPEPHNGRARLGINSIAHPNIPENFWTCSYEDALEQAGKIFQHDYWNALRLDEVTSQEVANKVYDMAVNMGVRTAARYVQGIVGVTVDGVLGSQSMAAINSYDPQRLVQYLRTISRQHYENLLRENPEEYRAWRDGWMQRANR